MDDAIIQNLLREKDRRIRDKNQEINYLRNALWEALYGNGEPLVGEPIATRQEESCGKTVLDSFVKSLLSDS